MVVIVSRIVLQNIVSLDVAGSFIRVDIIQPWYFYNYPFFYNSIMSLLASEIPHTTFPTRLDNSSGSGLLQQILKDPFDLLYQLYHSSSASLELSEQLQSSTVPSKEEKDPTKQNQFQRRLHSKAEACRSSLMAGTASVVLKRSQGDDESLHPEFTDLPVTLLLHIASFLDVKSLCRLQETNKKFHSLMSDELLWRRKLEDDSRKWAVTSHLSHPRLYEETSTDKTAQEM